jgi:PPOX class probable F420-dependent enzyme
VILWRPGFGRGAVRFLGEWRVPILDHTPEAAHRDERLRGDPIAWLGTVRPDGRPHLVPVWFSWDGDSLLILSQPDTQKVRNLRHDPRVTIALDDTRTGHDVVLFEGEAGLVSVRDESAAVAAYLSKYAELLSEMKWRPEAYVESYSQAIVVRPTRFVVW